MSAIDWKGTLETCTEAAERIERERPIGVCFVFGWYPPPTLRRNVKDIACRQIGATFRHSDRIIIKRFEVHL